MQERLQKIIAAAGITSRRKAEQLIVQGRVMVNGSIVAKLGSKADPSHDHIKVDGRLLRPVRGHVYLLLNKPPGYVSTLSDPQNRQTVISLLHGIKERVYPVGRLDYHSSGLLLLTNDGELANLLMSRASEVPRTYHVKLEREPQPADLGRLEQGIALEGRLTAPARIRRLANRENPWYEITLVEGRYHQVRRMFERIGCAVVKLKRVRIAFLTDRGTELGQFRHLTPPEVRRLKSWCTEAESRSSS
jgi:23S rRNA pseudouridine2605 synthase